MIDLEGMYICPQGLASQKIKNVFNGFSWLLDLKLQKNGGWVTNFSQSGL